MEHEPKPELEIIDFCLRALSKVIENDWQIVPRERVEGVIDELLDKRNEFREIGQKYVKPRWQS